MSQKPFLALDTSALNRLVKDADPEPIIAAILSGYSVNLPEMSFEEILATPDSGLRMRLVTLCRRLLGVGICTMPAHWVIDAHVKSFHANPAKYDWRRVNVRADMIEAEIHNGKFAQDGSLVEQQATEIKRLQDEFEGWFVRSADPIVRPNSFAEWLVQSRAVGGSLWNTTRLLYEGAFGSTSAIDKSAAIAAPPDETALRALVDACPPMRAMVYALELTLYDRSHRNLKALSYKAGRNDQMMAAFLPYCEQFLTNDRSQYRCLSEVASAAGILVTVKLYDDFCESHIIPARSITPRP